MAWCHWRQVNYRCVLFGTAWQQDWHLVRGLDGSPGNRLPTSASIASPSGPSKWPGWPKDQWIYDGWSTHISHINTYHADCSRSTLVCVTNVFNQAWYVDGCLDLVFGQSFSLIFQQSPSFRGWNLYPKAMNLLTSMYHNAITKNQVHHARLLATQKMMLHWRSLLQRCVLKRPQEKNTWFGW